MTKLGDIPLYRAVSAYDVVEQMTFRTTPDGSIGPYPSYKTVAGPRSGSMLLIAAGSSYNTAAGARAASNIPYRGAVGTLYSYVGCFGTLFFNFANSWEMHPTSGTLVTTNPGDELANLILAYNIFSGLSNTDAHWSGCAIVCEDGRSTTP